MKTFIALVPRIHGIHRIFFFHLIFKEQPILGIAILVALVLYAIYRYMNRR
ncbi:hypothetical protein [Lentilactobacillus sp. SPB1-3]|uniref:Uncharacterized protein n=1 Tax=Lentilactobacillus terminaliae TaxID=3003483 RepID=A0ACD5DF35_9LACO|nr:hypothetical protein [Lentilactobacillus sp. SPB1-3]MCZ0976251.1 hypothetical protein [Lentilactobacillus sp. SPB1-3]